MLILFRTVSTRQLLHHRARNEAKRSSVELRSLVEVEGVDFLESLVSITHLLIASGILHHHLFRSGHRHHGSASPSPTDTLADATHRCRASIRILNGPLLGPVQVGVRSKTQVHHSCDEPGIVGCCHLSRDLNRPALITQSPEQGGGCRCLPNLPDSSWFSRYQLMSAPGCRSDSSSRMRWRVPRSCSPWPLGSRRWGHRCGHARA